MPGFPESSARTPAFVLASFAPRGAISARSSARSPVWRQRLLILPMPDNMAVEALPSGKRQAGAWREAESGIVVSDALEYFDAPARRRHVLSASAQLVVTLSVTMRDYPTRWRYVFQRCRLIECRGPLFCHLHHASANIVSSACLSRAPCSFAYQRC